LKRLSLVALVIGASGASTGAQAFDFFGDMLRIEGFGTLGAFSSDLDPAVVPTPAGRTYVMPQVRADVRQSHGAADNKVIYDADTSLSVQATINPNGAVQGVLQLLSKQDIHASQRPQVEWAYGSWQATNELNLKLGRVVAPIFMLSDTRNVAYAQTMVRPFTSVYALNPITSLDGANFLWEANTGGFKYNIEGMVGQTEVALPSGTFKVPQLYGLATKWSRGDWSVRGGLSHLNVDVELIPSAQARLNAAININTSIPGSCPNCQAVLTSRTGLTGQTLNIFTLGGQWEHADYTVVAEFAERKGSSLIAPSYQSYYIMGAKRFNAWTPFVAWGRARNTEAALGLQNPQNQSAIADLDDARAFGRPNRTEQVLGLRWDFMPKAALKAQWNQYRFAAPRNGSGGQVQYYIPNPNNAFNGTVNSYALNLDFVF
jgi:hypothetical protein